MKTTNFFIEKANEYITSIDTILPNLLSPYSTGFDSNPEYEAQTEKLSDLRLKTKLLFTEFDKGELFNEQIASIDNNKLLWFEPAKVLKKYKHTLSLFVEHVNEFRN